jgi:FMN reductase
MSFFFSLSGSPTKFSKSGFLLRAIEFILEKRDFELRTAHAIDFDREHLATSASNRFIADVRQEIRRATAVLLISGVAKGNSIQLLSSLLDVLPDDALAEKPVLLLATGGFPGHVLTLEHVLKPTLLRLGAPTFAARVHLGDGSWRIAVDNQLRVSLEAEREITDALDLVLRGVFLRKGKRSPILASAQTVGRTVAQRTRKARGKARSRPLPSLDRRRV